MEKFFSQKELAGYLNSFGIKTGSWGRGSAKTVGHLAEEIEEGETVLFEENGELTRQIQVAGVNVFYQNRRLYEDRQEFSDGRIRKRTLAYSLSEKFKTHESPEDAAKRALREELGIDGKIDIKEIGKNIETEDSLSYPGLKTRYIIYGFETLLSPEQFSADGYVERGKDKKNYFLWKEIEQ